MLISSIYGQSILQPKSKRGKKRTRLGKRERAAKRYDLIQSMKNQERFKTVQEHRFETIQGQEILIPAKTERIKTFKAGPVTGGKPVLG